MKHTTQFVAEQLLAEICKGHKYNKNTTQPRWDRSAKKEQIKLEHEQMEVDCLKDVIENIPNYRVGRCSGKSFYFISVILLLLKYNVVLEN